MTTAFLETESIGLDFFTIDLLEKEARDFAVETYRTKKRDEYWAEQPMLDEASEEFMEQEFSRIYTDDFLIQELSFNNTFFDKEGLVLNKESFSRKED